MNAVRNGMIQLKMSAVSIGMVQRVERCEGRHDPVQTLRQSSLGEFSLPSTCDLESDSAAGLDRAAGSAGVMGSAGLEIPIGQKLSSKNLTGGLSVLGSVCVVNTVSAGRMAGRWPFSVSEFRQIARFTRLSRKRLHSCF